LCRDTAQAAFAWQLAGGTGLFALIAYAHVIKEIQPVRPPP